MSSDLTAQWQPANPERLAKQFSRLGWIGFWIQAALVSVPVLLLLYVLFVSSPESAQRKGIDLSNYFSYGNLMVLLFTTFWFYRYARLGKRIADPDLRPALSSVLKTLWIGLWAAFLSVAFSLVMMMTAVGRMLFVLLATPQTGVPLATLGGDPSTTLSAIDAVSMTTIVLTLSAELMVVAFSLWLLFGVTRPSTEVAQAAE